MPQGALQSSNTSLNRRKIAAGFVAVVLIVTALAFNSSVQIGRIIQGYDTLLHQPFAFSHAVKSIHFHTVTMSLRMQNLISAPDTKQRDKVLSNIIDTQSRIYHEYQIIDRLDNPQWEAVAKSKILFEQWLPLKQQVYLLLTEGKLKEAELLNNTQANAYLEKLKNNLGSLELLAHQIVDKYQAKSQKTSDTITIATFVLAVLAIVSVALLMLLVWRTIGITERARSRRQILIDQQILIAVLDKEGRTVDVSSALCKYLNCSSDELLGSRRKFFLANSNRNKQLEEDIINRISKGEQWHGETSYTTFNGDVLWAESSIIPIFDECYQVEGYTNILHDLTSKKLATIDKLTGLLNRRSYDEILTDQISLAVRNNLPISLAILDIDYFKRFNDSYGHPEGDVALKKVSSVLLKCLQRPSDFVFRIGGEEFAVLISGLNKQKIENYLNNIREKIQGLKIANKNSSVCPHLTISIGAVVLVEGALNEQALYKLADKALYEAKVKRNTVLVESYKGETKRA